MKEKPLIEILECSEYAEAIYALIEVEKKAEEPLKKIGVELESAPEFEHEQFSFENALFIMKNAGVRVRRSCWRLGCWMRLEKPKVDSAHKYDNGPRGEFFNFYDSNHDVLWQWVPHVSDILGEDWEIWHEDHLLDDEEPPF